MKHPCLILSLLLIFLCFSSGVVSAQKTIQIATMNWEPYTGEKLQYHGFFSELVTEALSKAGYKVEFEYYPWARGLHIAKTGAVHGLMNVYFKEDRKDFFEYPNVVWRVKERFICLVGTYINFTGELSSIQDCTIGVLRGSAQSAEIKAGQITVVEVNYIKQLIKLLIQKRVDAVLVPQEIFFYHFKNLYPDYDQSRIEVINPVYKTFDMYVVFSKMKYDYKTLTSDFNMGLRKIKADGIFEEILLKHNILVEQ